MSQLDESIAEGQVDHLADHEKLAQKANYVYDVTDYGAVGDGTTDDTVAIQAAIDAAFTQTQSGTQPTSATVYFPNGVYDTSAALTIAVTADTDARIRFAGETGRRGTRINQTDAAENVFEFSTTGGNLRGITMTQLTVIGGLNGIYMSKCAYLSFVGVSFKTQNNYGVEQADSYDLSFHDCWWVHLTGDSVSATNGSMIFTGCHFGEDAGHFFVQGYMQFTGCRLYQCNAKLDTGGMQSMGKEVFAVSGGAKLLVTGCEITGIDENLVNLNGNDEVAFIGNNITAGSGILIHVRSTVLKYPVQFVNNRVRVSDSGAMLFDSFVNQDPYWMTITGNAFMVDSAADLSFDDRILTSDFQNVIADNTIFGGSV